MNAALIFILLPFVVSLLLLLLHPYATVQRLIGLLNLLILAIIAWSVPLGEPIHLGFPGLPLVRIQPSFRIETLLLNYDNTSRAWVALVYSAMSIASLLTTIGRAPASINVYLCFVGAALSFVIGSDSFLVRLLGIALFSLAALPSFQMTEQQADRGIVRFLFFQIMGLSLLLLANTLPGNTSQAGESIPQIQAKPFLLGVGILSMMACFPFHSWLPLLCERLQPLPTTLVAYVHITAVMLIGAYFFTTETGGALPINLVQGIALFGALSAFVGGLFATAQKAPSKALGYGMVHQAGMGLLAMMQGFTPATNQFNPFSLVSLVFTQGTGVLFWALVLNFRTTSHAVEQLSPPRSHGYLLDAAQTIAILSMAGFPLLANFPIYLGIWEGLFSTSRILTVLSLTGSAMLAATALRWRGADKSEAPTLSAFERASLWLGLMILCLCGLLPQYLLAPWAGMFTFLSLGVP